MPSDRRHPNPRRRITLLVGILLLLTAVALPLAGGNRVGASLKTSDAVGVVAPTHDRERVPSASARTTLTKFGPDFSVLSRGLWAAGSAQDGGQESDVFLGREEPTEEELEGPDLIRERVEDYLRRHGMGEGFDPNQRLQAVRRAYDEAEVEKARSLRRAEAIPGTNWVSLGPTNGSGRIASIAVHPTMPGTVYAGAAGGGVWKTTDGGASWAPLTDSITDLFVGALAVAPSSPNVIYVGTGEGNTGTPGIGLLKSTDGGNTWQLPASVIATSFYKISVHPTNPQELVIGTRSGGYRSTDGGQNWATVISNNSDVTDIVRHPTDFQTLYATTTFPTQILKSTDGGATWAGKGSGVPLASLSRLSIAISASSPSVLYAAGATGDAVARIYKTTDGGESWFELTSLSNDLNLRNYFAVYNQSWYDNTLVVSPTDPNVVIAGGVSYVRTTDGGGTWARAFGFTNVHVDAHDLQYQGGTLYIGNDGGVWSSADNAQSSTDRNTGLVTRQYYTAANDPINRNRVYGGTQDNGTNRRSDAGGSDWSQIIGGDGFDCAVNPYAPEVFYGTVQNGIIQRTKAAGTTTYATESITPDYPSGEPGAGPFFTTLTMDPNNPSVLYTGSHRVWKSSDGGDTWSPLPTTTTDGSTWPASSLSEVAVARGDSRVIMVSHGFAVFRSVDGGSTWVEADHGLPYCNGIEIDPRNPNVAYAATPYTGGFYEQVYVTNDGGASWAPRSSGLPAFSTHVVRVDPTDSNVLFCGTDVGVYKSSDKGLSWTKFGAGLPNVSVYDLRILEDGSALRAATHGRGMWELQIPPGGNTRPAATISNPASGLTVVKGASVTLQGAVSDPDAGDSATGFWYFGDSGEVVALNGGSATHVFNRTGVFALSLTARDTHGALGNASRAVTVTETFDGCATPWAVPGGGPFPVSVTATKEGGTKEATDPKTPCLGNAVSHSFWFEFTPAVSGIYRFTTANTYLPDIISLWKGSACGPYTAVPSACAYSAPVSAYIAAGATMRIMVSSWDESDTGTVTLTASKVAECSFTLGSTSQSFSASGGAGSIAVNTAGGCGSPPATVTDSWLTVAPSDTSAVRYVVAANYGSQPRTGTIDVGGQTFTVQQGGATTACAAPPQGMVAWWRGEGNGLDETGVNYGTFVPGAAFDGGKVGGGFAADAVNSPGVMQVPDSPSLALTTKSMTFEGWLKANSFGGTVIYRRTDDFRGSYQVWMAPNGQLLFTVWHTNNSGVGVNSDPLPLGQFVHFAASLDDATGQIKMYINGSLVRQFTITQRPNNITGARVYVGGLTGVTDELSVYNRALSASEIQAVYNAGAAAAGAAGKCLLSANPIDTAGYFVRQHYYDFLGREPDASGLAFWTNEITSCGADAQCVEVKRINVSGAYFLSIEFQETGYLVHRMYKAAYGDATGASTFPSAHQLAVPVVRRAEFVADTLSIGRGVVVLQPGWEQQLEGNKQAFALAFVQTARFAAAYPATLTAAELVNKLDANAGGVLDGAEKAGLVSTLGTTPSDPTKRALVLRAVAENAELQRRESNRAFVLMQYFGYLRRNPNDAPDADYTGYDFWLTKLNQFGGDFVRAEMVKAFLDSVEYRDRFRR